MKKWLLCCLLILILIITILTSIGAQQTNVVYIYDITRSSDQNSYMNYFYVSKFNVVLYNINYSSENNFSSTNDFSKIVKNLIIYGIQIVYPGECVTCILTYQTWDEMMQNYATPLIGYFHNGKLISITLGITNTEILKEALLVGGNGIKVFSHHGEYSIKNETVIAELGKLFQQEK